MRVMVVIHNGRHWPCYSSADVGGGMGEWQSLGLSRIWWKVRG